MQPQPKNPCHQDRQRIKLGGGGLHIKWLVRAEMPDVLDIENASFEFPWSEETFIRCLRQRNCIGKVAIYDDQIAGFVIYELHKNRLHVLNVAVHPAFRRRGVATEMINNLIGSLSAQRRNRITLEVRETNLDAQLFFRSLGFRAVSVLRDFYDDTTEDAYSMEYRLNSRFGEFFGVGDVDS